MPYGALFARSLDLCAPAWATNVFQRDINRVVSKIKIKKKLWFWRDKAALLIRRGLIRPGLCSPKSCVGKGRGGTKGGGLGILGIRLVRSCTPVPCGREPEPMVLGPQKYICLLRIFRRKKNTTTNNNNNNNKHTNNSNNNNSNTTNNKKNIY